MLKRLVGVITVKNNWAVQSVGYERYYPLGRPEILAENLDHWLLDEILIVDIDRTRASLGPNFNLVRAISSKNVMTPLCYIGGVRGAEDALELVANGADRVGMDNLFRNDLSAASAVAGVIGRQAVVRSQPIVRKKDGLYLYDYIAKEAKQKLDLSAVMKSADYFSEFLAVDVVNEGGIDSFNEDIIEPFASVNLQLVCFGGITTSAQVADLHERKNVSAVAVGNSLNYREIANRKLLSLSNEDLTRSTTFGLATKGARDW